MYIYIYILHVKYAYVYMHICNIQQHAALKYVSQHILHPKYPRPLGSKREGCPQWGAKIHLRMCAI